jgi:hypothetical protein
MIITALPLKVKYNAKTHEGSAPLDDRSTRCCQQVTTPPLIVFANLLLGSGPSYPVRRCILGFA